MNELLAAFLAAIAGIKDQANAMLAGLPPLEQFEASADISYGIRSLQRYGNELVAAADNLSGKVKGFVTQSTETITAEAKAKAQEVLLAAGEFIKKVDAEAAQGLVLAAKEKELRDSFTAERQKETVVKAKRAKLVADKTVPLVVAEMLSDAVLGGEKADEDIAAINLRLKKLTDLGLTAEVAPKVFAEIAGISLDAAGDTLFDTRYESIKEARGSAAAAAPGRGGNPLAGASAGAGGKYTTNQLV